MKLENDITVTKKKQSEVNIQKTTSQNVKYQSNMQNETIFDDTHDNKLDENKNKIEDLYNMLHNASNINTDKLSSEIQKISKDQFLEYFFSYGNLISDILKCKNIDSKIKMQYADVLLKRLITDISVSDSEFYVDDIKSEWNSIYDRCSKDGINIVNSKRIESLVTTIITRYMVPMIYAEYKYGPMDAKAPNGKIDDDFRQGLAPDCWLIASLEALVNNPKGLKILNELITVDDNGNTTVLLKGPNKRYTITKEELEGRIDLACGDLDVRAIEIAFDKYMKEENSNLNPVQRFFRQFSKKHLSPRYMGIKNQGTNELILPYTILLGEGKLNTSFLRNKTMKPVCQETIDKAKSEDCIMIVLNEENVDYASENAFDENGKKVKIPSNHVLAVLKVDDKFVYVKDPSVGTHIFHMTHDEFLKAFKFYNEFIIK